MKTKIFFIIIVNLLFCGVQFAQSITNTLGTSGLFKIKDGSVDYLTLTQSTGQVNILKTLRLENTTGSATGIIFKGANRFLHNYGTGNVFLGVNSGNFTMDNSSSCNTVIGDSSLFSNIGGFSNTAIGFSSLKFNMWGYSNAAVGNKSLFSNYDGDFNTAVGDRSLYFNTSGNENTAIGYQSLYRNQSYYNTAVGNEALFLNYSGAYNTALGRQSLSSNYDGIGNTAVGSDALSFNYSGSFNTALGYNSGGIVTSGTNLTLIGNDANPSSGTAVNQVTLGNNQITSLRCNVTTITSLSDARDKKNITDLNLGISFLMKLKPRIYNWDKREWYEDNVSDGSKMQEASTAGFIAQELDEVQITENAEWLNLVLKDNPEKWEATYGNLLPVVVKAIQELKTENDGLKSENIELKERLLKLEEMQNTLALEIEKMNSKNNNTEVKITEKK